MADNQQIISQLTQATDSLYGNTDPSMKDQANSFLLTFQRSEDAWKVIFPILGDESASSQLTVFISQTLRSKVQYDFNQLPKESLVSLKDSLIQLMIAYNEKNRLITTQLCISLAYFALQFLEWDNSVNEIITLLSPNSMSTLLEFLMILPEETMDVKKTPLTDEEFDIRTKKLVANNVEQIMYILCTLAETRSSNTASTNALILGCIKSWVSEIPFSEILSSEPLCSLIFEGLSNEDTFDTAIESLSTIISTTDVSPDNSNIPVIKALFDQLIRMRPLITESQDDPNKIERFAELFATAGESWHVLIAMSPYDFKPLVEILLQLTSYEEDLDIVKYTFKFWYELKIILTAETRKEAKTVFTPIYTELVHVMLKHLRYPMTSDSTNLRDLFDDDREAEDKFKDFRYSMGDVLKDCCGVIGSVNALNIPFTKLQNFMNLVQQGQQVPWQEIEAPLFSMRAMATEVSSNEDKILPEIMRYLIQLPENPKIRYAATLVLGRYTEWTAKHPQHLEEQLNYIIHGFQQQQSIDVIVAASYALKYFCMDCCKLLNGYLEQLFNFYSNIEGSLDIESLYDVTEGIAHVLKEERDFEKLYNITLMFWKPTLEKLDQYNELQPSNAHELDELQTKIADTIEILSIYVDALKPKTFQNPENPIAKILIEYVWPLILKLVSTHGRSAKVSERCMKLVRKSIQTFQSYLLPVLSSTAEILVYGFDNYRHGCFLWVSGTFISEYSSDDALPTEVKESVWNFSIQQTNAFLKFFNELGEDRIHEYPDLVEDFYRMVADILMFSPVRLIQADDIVQPIYETAIKSLGIYFEVGTLSSVMQFLIDFYSWGFETPPISLAEDIPNDLKLKVLNFTLNTGEDLVSRLIYGLIYTFPSDCTADASELIVKLIKLSTMGGSSRVSMSWLEKFLSTLPPNTVNSRERLKLLSTVEAAINSKDYRKVRSSVKDFVNWYRRKNVDRIY